MRISPKESEIIPFRTMMMPEQFYQGLDVGIRFAVRVIHAAGFETCQSCQGGKGHAYPEPAVDLIASHSDSWGFGALAQLHDFGLPVSTVAIVWNIANGLAYEKLWRITFSRTMEARANDKPNFLWGYRAQ